MKTLLATLAVIYFFSGFVNAQETNSEEFKPKIRGAIMMANSHIPTATVGGRHVSVIPTWGFDADYFFHPRWSVALQSDLKLQSFEIEEGDALLTRSFPLAFTTLIHYHALHHWSFYTGPGYEFEKSKNLFLFKVGTEYSFEITEKFEIALNLIYENRQEVYDGWTFGIAFNKKLWERK